MSGLHISQKMVEALPQMQMAMEILGEAFINLQAGGDAEEMMRIAIERANSAIYQMSSDLPQLSTMATTVVALHIDGNIASIGHVGDSRLYRLDGKGSLYRETQDHSVVEEEVRAGRMTAAQAANHPSRNVISRALGADNTVEVDMKTIMFDGNTKFLLCSDGITRHISDLELRELLLANASPAEVCAKMKEICYSRGAEDNLTAVIVNVFRNAEENIEDLPTVIPNVDEEATVATARQAVSEPLSLNAENGYDEIPTRALEMPVSMQETPASQETVPPTGNFSYSSDDDEQYLMEEPVQDVPQTPPQPAETPVPAEFPLSEISEAPAFVTPKNVESPKDFRTYETAEKNGGGFVGKLLSSLIFLVIGAVLGAGAIYLWQTMTAKPAEVSPITPQSNNIPNSSLVTSMYNAETNPEKFIELYDTITTKDASDFYLLGRAFLKLKNYEEAKKHFILARNNLREVKDVETKAILETEIAQGLTISQDKATQTAFEREANVLRGSEPVNTANSNQ